SPSAEKLAVSFKKLGYSSWSKYAEEKGRIVVIKMPDHSSLYLDTQLTKADQEYLAKAFWDQRWSRYVSFTKFWVPMLMVPPIVLFILGWAILWVCRGFKTA